MSAHPLALVPCSVVGPRRAEVIDAVDGRRFRLPRRPGGWPGGWQWVEVEVLFEWGPVTRVRFRATRLAFWVATAAVVPIDTPETPR